MTRRITAAVVAVVVGTLLIAGVGTLIATRLAGKARETNALEERAEAIAELVPNLDRAGATNGADTKLQAAVADARAKVIDVLGLSGVTQLRVTKAGRLAGDPPSWIPADDLAVDALLDGQTLSGARGNRLWAAAARANPNGSATVAVVTDTREAIIGPALRWLAVSTGVTVMVGAAVSFLLARRLGRPLRGAVDVTRRLADGDLSARLPDAPTSGDELDQLTAAINSMATQLERSRGLEHQFLMSVSHDLRTPLTSIRGYAEAIGDGVADPATSAAVIVAESQRLERLVADLLDLAKLDARQFGFRPVVGDLGPSIAAAVARIAPEADAAGLDIRVAHDVVTPVNVDPDRVAQIVGNLTSNCLRYARTAVWIRTRPATGPQGRAGVALDIADDGTGIAADDLPHVFERLYQARNQVEARESGSGLGLAIVKELVEGMGGSVDVASVPQTGTTFTVWFPAA